jgi:hypothetical protein
VGSCKAACPAPSEACTCKRPDARSEDHGTYVKPGYIDTARIIKGERLLSESASQSVSQSVNTYGQASVTPFVRAIGIPALSNTTCGRSRRDRIFWPPPASSTTFSYALFGDPPHVKPPSVPAVHVILAPPAEARNGPSRCSRQSQSQCQQVTQKGTDRQTNMLTAQHHTHTPERYL